jgi:hypothetical protein
MPSRHATPRRPAKAPAQAQIASDRAPAPSPARDDDSADMGISANFAKEEKNDKAAADLRWARNQHVKVAAAVRARNCKQASVLALALSNRAPAYYARNVQNDRNLKQCITYINAEREREAERMARRRALKRQADEEAASAKKAKAAAPASRK